MQVPFVEDQFIHVQDPGFSLDLIYLELSTTAAVHENAVLSPIDKTTYHQGKQSSPHYPLQHLKRKRYNFDNSQSCLVLKLLKYNKIYDTCWRGAVARVFI